ncbi:MAG TPA: hypothetical protein VGD24_09050 [Gallionella sp.]
MSFVSSLFAGKPDHPMFSVAEAARLLDDLPRDNPVKSLNEISAWLDSVKDASGFRPELRSEIVLLLDEAGQPFYTELLQLFLGEPHLQDFQGLKLWQGLHGYMQVLSEAYDICLHELQEKSIPADFSARLPVVCVRAMHTLAEQFKIEMMHYVDIGQQFWNRLFHCYNFSTAHQLAETMIFAYPRQTIHISPQRELLRIMVLYESSLATLAQDQIEVGFRIASRMVSFFDFIDTPHPDCPYYLDLAQPGPPRLVPQGLHATATMRFFGATRAVSKVAEIIAQHVYGTIQQEQRFGSEFTPAGKLTVLKHMQLYWAKDHPYRLQERRVISTAVDVVHSFATISRLVTRMDIDNAANLSEKDAAMLKERADINLVASEEAVDYVTEKWTITDLSLTGIGAIIPKNAGAWVKIGDLVGLKAEHSPLWWTGVIRRLHTDARNSLHVGIEMLAKKPLSVWLRTLGKGVEKVSAWESSSGSFDYDYLTVILLPDANNSYANATMLMEPGGYVPDTIYEVMLGEKSRNIRLTGLLAEGEDYEQVSFQWLGKTAT